MAGMQRRCLDGDRILTIDAFTHLQLHEGAPVVTGRKYVSRTDVMYAVAVNPRHA